MDLGSVALAMARPFPRLVFTGAILALFVPVAGLAEWKPNGFDLSRSTVPAGSVVVGGPARDGIPALTDPRMETAAEAGLEPEDLVVGLVVDQEARAYPLRILNWHEVVNDRIGDRPVVVTYCPLTDSAVVFDRRIEGRTLEFGVSGLLHDSNVLLYDRDSSSLWSQMAQSAVAGPRAGTPLRAIPARVLPWRVWREDHPDSLVMSRETGHRRDYGVDPYARYPRSGTTWFPVSHRDERLPMKERVLGVTVDGTPYAFLLSGLAGLHEPLRLALGGRAVVIPDGTGRVMIDGRSEAATIAYWFAWSSFHPTTALWTTESRPVDSPTATADGRPTGEVVLDNLSGHWENLNALFMGAPTDVRDADAPGTVYVVRGEVHNRSQDPIDHVVLSFELLDADARTVVRIEGFNQQAEVLLDGRGSPTAAELKKIPPGGRDTFRMVFFAEETPPFRDHRVVVQSVHR